MHAACTVSTSEVRNRGKPILSADTNSGEIALKGYITQCRTVESLNLRIHISEPFNSTEPW